MWFPTHRTKTKTSDGWFCADQAQDEGFAERGVPGVEGDCFAGEGKRVAGLSLLVGDGGEVAVDFGLGGVEAQGFAQVFGGLVELAIGEGFVTEGGLDDGVLGLGLFQFIQGF